VSASTLATGVVGLALLGLFVVLQAHRREPPMRLGIFKAPNLAAVKVAPFMLGAAWTPMLFLANLYLQQVVGLGAFASGAALLPLTVTIHGRDGRCRPAADRTLRSEGHEGLRLATLSVGLVWLASIPPDGASPAVFSLIARRRCRHSP